jgi:hypothetical protein
VITPSHDVTKSDAETRSCVSMGSSPPRSSNMLANVGTMKISITVESMIAITKTMTG